jgi:hypothetical protein
MEATKLDPEYLHRLSQFYPQILEHIETLRPDIHQEGETYSCISANPEFQIKGTGKSPQDAVEDWEKEYQKVHADGKI